VVDVVFLTGSPPPAVHLAEGGAVTNGHVAGSPLHVVLVAVPRLIAEALATGLAAHAPSCIVHAYPDPAAAVECSAGELAGVLRGQLPELKVVVIAAVAARERVAEWIDAGIRGHVAADCSLAELAGAIERVAAGEILFDAVTVLKLLAEARERPDPLRPPPEPAGPHLGARELEVLRLAARALTADQIAARLGISPHTVRTHLKNTAAKLGAHSRLETVLRASKAGLIELPEEDLDGAPARRE
jgi:DNA-binding NarL/FixJ family response regulator